MTTDWQPEKYRDTYRDRVEALIEERRNGVVVAHEQPEAPPAPVIDLLEALQASVNALRPGPSPVPNASDGEPQRPARSRRREEVAAPAASTKAELLQRAGELGIAGRSKMSREDLEEAISGATKSRRRAS